MMPTPVLESGRRHAVAFTLNGKRVQGEAEPRMLLHDFLRHGLGATGTHVGCEHGVCGACTVQIDGAPARACLAFAVQAEARDIRTVEGLAPAPDRPRRAAGGVPHAISPCNAASARRHPDVARRLPARPPRRRRARRARGAVRPSLPLHRLRADREGGARRRGARRCGRRRGCLTSAPASSPASTRDPAALAIVDGDTRLTYAALVRSASARRRRRAATSSACARATTCSPLLQNRWEAATLHWACQFAGVIITPLNWRAKADELDYCRDRRRSPRRRLRDRPRPRRSRRRPPQWRCPRITVGHSRRAGETAFADPCPRRRRHRAARHRRATGR